MENKSGHMRPMNLFLRNGTLALRIEESKGGKCSTRSVHACAIRSKLEDSVLRGFLFVAHLNL